MLLNVIILSALIPSLRNDVTYMQGQTAQISAQVNTMQQSLLGINDKINGADTAINTFNANLASVNSQFNATEAYISAFQTSTKADLQAMKDQSVSILASFQQASTAYEQQLNVTLTSAQAQASTIEQQLAAAQSSLQLVLQQLAQQNATIQAQLAQQASSYTAAADSSSRISSRSTHPRSRRWWKCETTS